MTNFRKVLNFRFILLLIGTSFLFSDRVYSYPVLKDPALRIPVGQKGTYRRITTTLPSNGNIRRRDFMKAIILASGWKGLKPSMDENEEFDRLFNKIIKLYSNMYEAIKKEKKVEVYDRELQGLMKELRAVVKEKGHLEPLNPFIKLLVSSLDSNENIFDVIEKSNIDPKVKLELRKELTACVAKTRLSYLLLSRIGITNVKIFISPEHVSTAVSLGDNRYLLADFTLNLFMIVDLSDSKNSHYYKQGGYWFLRDDYRISPERLAILKMRFRNEGLALLLELSEQELLNAFYPSIYEPPDTYRRNNGLAGINGGHLSIRLKRGLTYLTLGLLEKAEEEYKRGIEIDPMYAEIHDNLGIVYTRRGRFNDAVNSIQRATSLNPKNAQTYCNLGGAYAGLEKWDEAEKALKQAIELNPNLAMAYGNLGDVYVHSGRYLNAIEPYKKAIELSPKDSSFHYGLGLAYYNLDKYSEAISAFENVRKLEPHSWLIHFELGLVQLYKMNDPKKAVKLFERAAELKPDKYEIYVSLGWAYYKSDMTQKAIQAWAKAYALNNKIKLEELPLSEKEREKIRSSVGKLGLLGHPASYSIIYSSL